MCYSRQPGADAQQILIVINLPSEPLPNHHKNHHFGADVHWDQVPARRYVSPRNDSLIKMHDGLGLTIIPSLMSKEAKIVKVAVSGMGKVISDRWLMPRSQQSSRQCQKKWVVIYIFSVTLPPFPHSWPLASQHITESALGWIFLSQILSNYSPQNLETIFLFSLSLPPYLSLIHTHTLKI